MAIPAEAKDQENPCEHLTFLPAGFCLWKTSNLTAAFDLHAREMVKSTLPMHAMDERLLGGKFFAFHLAYTELFSGSAFENHLRDQAPAKLTQGVD